MSVYVVGAGGLGREVHDAALAAGIAITGFLDDARAGDRVRGLRVALPGRALRGAGYVVAIADPAARQRLAGMLDARGLHTVSVLHPRAIVGPETRVGDGSVVLGGAHVSSDVRLGEHAHVHYHATVGHDAVLGDRVSVYPGANVGGSVVVAEDATVGSNATVLQGRRIGPGAVVGAGAVVTRDVDGGVIVAGVPARPLPAR